MFSLRIPCILWWHLLSSRSEGQPCTLWTQNNIRLLQKMYDSPIFLWMTVDKDKDRREGKGRRCYWLRDLLECRTNHLASRMIWTKDFGRTSILVGSWFDWNDKRMIIHFSKASIPPSSLYSIHPFLQIILVEASVARIWINSVPQTAATSFALLLSLTFFYGVIATLKEGNDN